MRKTIFLTVSLTVMSVLTVFAQVSDLLSLEAKDQFNAGNFEACVEEMTKLIQSNPTNDEAYFERGRCQYFSADYNKIRAEKSKTITDEDKMIEAADLEFDSRRIRAIEDATKAISLNSQNAGAYNLRGLVTSKIYANGPDAEAKRAASAMADYNQAIRIDPRLVKAYINRASEFYTYSQYEEALSDLKIANSIEPENELVKTVMATVMKRIEDMKTLAEECLNSDRPYQCAETLKKYAEAHPNSAKAYLDFARVSNSVEAYSEVQSPEVFWLDAEAAYLKVIALSPKEMPAYAELYDLYLRKLGQKNKATDISVNAEKQMPQNADAVLLRGQNALLLLDPNKALAYFNKSIELDASNSEAYVGRGDAYLMLKDYAQSMSDYTRAIELDRSNGQVFSKEENYLLHRKNMRKLLLILPPQTILR
jgi:tetratricopeptide (TPR) repeat protein